MAPVIHCSTGSISLFPRTTFVPRKDNQLTKYNASGKHTRLTSYYQRLLLPQPSLGIFQIYRSGCGSKQQPRIQIVAAVGTDVTVEEPNPAVSAADETLEDADETLESPSKSVETSETAPTNPSVTTTARSKRLRPVRKSEMPPVKDEEIVPGASFTGKVRSIQPFGAFVDFGAYTDGLVHVSRMSDGYVKDVGALVSIGQEVKVRIVEANKESGRISLTMRDSDDTSKMQQRKEVPTSGSSDKPRPVRKNAARSNQKRDEVQKSSKFVKGQVLNGTVKNLTRSGAFVSLPEGEEGFLPVSEESEGFGSILGNSSLQVGQEVNARVLRITRGKVTLTMKKEEDVKGLNMQLNQGVVHIATNPFELAFRKNKDIAVFLEERDRAQKTSEMLSMSKTSEQIGEKLCETITKSDTLAVDDSTSNSDENQVSIFSASGAVLEEEKIISEELHEETSSVGSTSTELVSNEEEPGSSSTQNANAVLEILPEDERSKTLTGSSSDSVLGEIPIPDDVRDSSAAIENVEEQVDSSKSLTLEESESSANGSASLAMDEASVTNEDKVEGNDVRVVEENEKVLISESLVSDEVNVSNEVKESDVATITEDEASSESLGAEKVGSSADSLTGVGAVTAEETNLDTQSSGEIDDPILSSEGMVSEEVPSIQSDGILVNDKVVTETPLLVENEMASSSKDVKENAPEASNGQTGIPDQGSTIKATISPALVKQLREETGAGMMDCKKALTETGGDIVKAQEFLRKKGLASADKKASRATAEGRVGSYVHDNRIGVLIEVNCETDFVSRGEIFKNLVDDLAMQVAACPQVRYLVTEDVPEEIVTKEKEIEMQKEDLLTKPEQIRSKIVDGRIRKRLEEFALLEQPYIKNDKVVVKDLVKQTIATIGENIKVKRFVRYNLGEGLEKKSQDFAAEVAAQTAAKPSPAAPMDTSAEAKETLEKAPIITVSATLVKQLREETGAGMMDCKKALTETGGDLEKAQEYLRKKGLSSADKKSSRLAAEGRLSSYIHDTRIGALIEVNSETDFVARNEKFKELVDDLAMQVVACPQVEFVSVEDIPESIVSKEKEIEMQKEDLKSKPEHIREKIVEGRISKRLGELALLEQPFIKDDSVMVKDLVKQTVAALGENIRVRRFVRLTLGEGKD